MEPLKPETALNGVDCSYAKNLGYVMAHIWACPPSEGDDYIFHSHSTEQKIPKPKRLQDWYKKMLDKGIVEGCVLEYKVRVSPILALQLSSIRLTLSSLSISRMLSKLSLAISRTERR